MSRRPFFPFERELLTTVPAESEVPPWAGVLLRQQDLILSYLETLMPTMQDIKDAAQRNTNATQSFAQVLQGVSQQLKEAQAQNDPAAVQEVITQLDANTQALATAAAANTPAQGQGAAQTPGGGTPTPPATPPAGQPPA